MLREKPLPPVTDLRVCLDVKLAPERWSPVGKAWIQVVNVNDDFSIGEGPNRFNYLEVYLLIFL